VLEDGEIIRRCLGGQTGMMDLLIDRYKTDLYSLCVKLARDRGDADDLFQDTWVRVMKSLKSYNPENRFKTWLFAICTNRYRDLYRWRRRWWKRVSRLGERSGREGEPRPDDETAFMESDDPTPEERVISLESRGMVRQALDGLDDAFRLPILLHYFEDLSVAEIAVVMEIPEGTVKTRLSRGRDKLRDAIGSAESER
jgi:RNA polymerase sigma-70 factor (ECF subfamily)